MPSSKVQLSTTFSIEEVHLILMVARNLQRHGDVSVLVRHPAWQNIIRKFQRMELKARNHHTQKHQTEVEPLEKPAPDPNLERDLQKNVTFDSTRQHFLDQGYTLSEVEMIVHQLKKS